MNRAIVLSGGGARGSYQIGVWRGLRKLHIKYNIVAGTSVGALNGALMTQNTYLRGIWFWYNINDKQVFRDGIVKNYKTAEGKKTMIKKYAKAILVDSGMDVTKLEENISKVLNERKFRKSNINFGLVTFNLSTLKPIVLTKDKIPYGKVNDYLMASATCFPAFKKKQIDNDNYIDGAYYDNLPINVAIEMGATDIIAVDLKGIGMKRSIKDKDVNITYISPRNNLGSFLIFDKEPARRGIRLGFNDTLKTFNKLDGNKYTFKLGHLHNNFIKYEYSYKKLLNNIFGPTENDNMINKIIKKTIYKCEIKEKELNKTIETLGKIFEIDDSYIYDIVKFNNMLLNEFEQMPLLDKKLIENKIKENDVKSLINSKIIIKYIYDKIVKYSKNNEFKKELSSISLLLPREFLCALYLYIINKTNRE